MSQSLEKQKKFQAMPKKWLQFKEKY